MKLTNTIKLAFIFGASAMTATMAYADDAKKINTDKPCISGIYPHLSMWNSEGECGTGAVVPWAGKLWAVTYGPHVVFKSDDRLYEIDENLNQTIRKESLGGTHANRMIHKESNQLVIGCYFIDDKGNVRAIPRDVMPGRLTGNARSIDNPAQKVYFATMEEALYEVDVKTLEVKEIIRDGNLKPHKQKTDADGKIVKQPQISKLHGYHGKGLYSGFGKVFYANNGVHHKDVDKNPMLPSGALGEWSIGDADWTPIRINQFTEITSRDGIMGNMHPDSAPIWSLGFDAKSVILMLCDNGKWHSLRLPKASHSYDGSHGWNTEWPRIRDIGNKDYLMTMHGAFWNFPPTFSAENMGGIRMRSNYLKVIGDFCRWQNKIVLGCDDSAQKEFMNKRELKSEHVSPGQSNSNLVFADDNYIDSLGPIIGRASLFLREDAKKGATSDPLLTGGFKTRILAITHSTPTEVKIEIQACGNDGKFAPVKTVELSANGSKFIDLSDIDAEWIKLVALDDIKNITAHFDMSNPDNRGNIADKIFDGISTFGDKTSTAALLWSMGAKTHKMAVVSSELKDGEVKSIGDYTMNKSLELATEKMPKNSAKAKSTAYKAKGISYDNDSILIIENDMRWRLPINNKVPFENAYGYPRVAREVATERDLMNCGGTFYELPARNAQGIAKVRPIASHNLDIFDYASYCGLMFISGLKPEAVNMKSEHIIPSKDGKFALWAGSIDDLWKLGKPVGQGSIWFNEKVADGQISDPFLMTGFDKKSMAVKSSSPLSFVIEVDVDGTGIWIPYETIKVEADKDLLKQFDRTFKGYWLRLRALNNADKVSVKMIYQ